MAGRNDDDASVAAADRFAVSRIAEQRSTLKAGIPDIPAFIDGGGIAARWPQRQDIQTGLR
jgi:hypothetical protein